MTDQILLAVWVGGITIFLARLWWHYWRGQWRRSHLAYPRWATGTNPSLHDVLHDCQASTMASQARRNV